MKKNWRNRIENAILVLIAVFMTFHVTKGIYQDQLNKQQETIVELSQITRYVIQNEFGKTKAKDGTINLNLDNAMDVDGRSQNQNNTIAEPTKTEDQTFWDRIFKRNKKE